MTKELLLKDLCARLPYKTICKDIYSNLGLLLDLVPELNSVTLKISELGSTFTTDIENIKPYLRPIPDMTKDEAEELFRILDIKEDKGEWLKINDVGIIRLFTQLGKDFFEISDAMDYLNSIHIDYRGLIPIGLALEAPKGMYNT